MSVDFPVPLAPTSAVFSLLRMSQFASRKRMRGPNRLPAFCSESISSIFADSRLTRRLCHNRLEAFNLGKDKKMTREEKYTAFQALHQRPGVFLIPNPWNAGSARILAALGFEALATTSGGYAFSAGLMDSPQALTRNGILANAQSIAEATDLPVSADLQNGFGDAPEACAETIRLAAQAGLAGGSIEDSTGKADEPIYDFHLAVERVAAAAGAAHASHFLLTARCENFLCGHPDLDDTIGRLQAFAEAGADVLYAPAL